MEPFRVYTLSLYTYKRGTDYVREPGLSRYCIETIRQYDDRQSRTRGAEDISKKTCRLKILKDEKSFPAYTRTNKPFKKS